MRRRMSLLLVLSLVATLLPSLAITAAAETATGPDVVISQVYGGGGNTGASYRYDFVELFNRGDVTQNLTGWSVQYAAQAGTNWSNTTPLTGSIEPGQRYLIQMASGANTAAQPLPTPDVTGTTAMSGTNAKVALVSSTTVLPAGDCPTGATVVDAVAYGSTTCSAIAITGTTNLTNNQSALRDDGRCGDTFTISAPPQPENSAAPLTPCGEPVNQPIQTSCSPLAVAEGVGGSVAVSATDPDGVVVGAAITEGAVTGISLENVVAATAEGGTLTADLTADATLAVGSYDVTITFTNDDAEAQTATCIVAVGVQTNVCEVPDEGVTPINEVQGSGLATPLADEVVVTRGVVTTAYPSGGATGLPNSHGLRGFFIEAVEDDRDDDPQTSEGLFVFDFAGLYDAELGDLVYVEGTAGESFGLTQVASDNFDVCDIAGLDTALPPPAELPMPVAPADRAEALEPFESMRVTHDELTLVEFFQLERFGDVRVSSGGIFDNPTNVVDPRDDDAYNAIFDFNAANNIILSSGRTAQNIDRPGPAGTPPLPFVEPGDTLRIGDQLIDQTFVLHYSFSNWRLQPIDIDELSEQFQKNRTRPRPLTPPEVGGSLTVASYNVLNYFNGDGQGGEFPTARGARNQAELDRQTEKLVAAVTEIDADIVGLIEMENDGGEFQATWTFVEALNEAYGEEVYDFVDTGVIGSDAIKQAFIYKPSTVEATGDYALLDSSVDARFDDTRSRPALAQTFTELATGEAITVTVNHLKSKGSNCGGAPDDDARQGNCNGTRTEAAKAIADWMNSDPTEQEVVGGLIIGDINAYAEEDPITEIVERGYVDMLKVFAPEDGPVPYSYTFDATQGRLDHALADEDLAPFVTGADEWHINADETQAIDYQLSGPGSFRTAAVAEQYYQPNAFRSSDHDPVIIGLQLGEAPVGVKLLATNDFHGRIGRNTFNPTTGVRTGYPSAAYLSSIFKGIRAEHPNTLQVDAGDLVGASPALSNLFFDEPTVEVMNEIGLDVQTVGNHEFDRGQAEILRRAEGGCRGGDCSYRDGAEYLGQQFTTLSANVTTGPELSDPTLMDPYAIYTVGGVDIGFIGVTTVDTPNVVHPAGIEGLTFHGEADAVNEWVPELQDEGVDAIVVLLHEGGRQDGNANACTNFRGAAATIISELDEAVDVVITGHTHQSYVCDLEGGPLVTSANQYGAMYTEIDLVIEPGVGVVSREAVNRTVNASLSSPVVPDQAIVDLVAHYEQLAGPLFAEIVGTSTVPIPQTTRLAESAQGNLATDALVDQYEGIDFAFQNSGGLRAALTKDADKDGELYNIRRENVLEVWPFGNTVWLAEIDGTQLKAILDNGVRQVGGGRFIQLSGMKIEYFIDESVPLAANGGFPRGVIHSATYWKHPDRADGTPVDLSASATYQIAMNDFMAGGGDGYPNIAEDVYFRDEGLELILERYLKQSSPVSPTIEGRITQIDAAPTTTITSGPTGTVTETTATFEFEANRQGATFECQLDDGEWAACTSPKSYESLSDGSHTFRVRATNPIGSAVGEPAVRTWTVSSRPIAPTDKEECRNGGWQREYRDVTFRNQGQCVAYVVANPRSGSAR
jgi:predicted extracellular nuclease/2',3'-cyclic-nucleotide 2'-phosphodiesterase (5'-nucleotidase family)